MKGDTGVEGALVGLRWRLTPLGEALLVSLSAMSVGAAVQLKRSRVDPRSKWSR